MLRILRLDSTSPKPLNTPHYEMDRIERKHKSRNHSGEQSPPRALSAEKSANSSANAANNRGAYNIENRNAAHVSLRNDQANR